MLSALKSSVKGITSCVGWAKCITAYTSAENTNTLIIMSFFKLSRLETYAPKIAKSVPRAVAMIIKGNKITKPVSANSMVPKSRTLA